MLRPPPAWKEPPPPRKLPPERPPPPAKGAAAAHAAEAASTGRPRPAAGRAGSAGAPVIVGATAASAAKPIPQPETEQPAKARTGPAAAKGGENIDHRRNDDKIGDDRDPGRGPRRRGFVVTVVGMEAGAAGDRAGVAAEGHTVDIGDGVCHVLCTGGHSGVIILRREAVLHGLRQSAGLFFQRRVPETGAQRHIVVAVLVLLGLHDQKNQHTVVFAGTAEAPCVEGFGRVIFRG